MSENDLKIVWDMGSKSMESYLRDVFATYDDTYVWEQEGNGLTLMIAESKYCEFIFNIKESKVILTEKFFVLMHALCCIPSNEVIEGRFVMDKYVPNNFKVEMDRTRFIIHNK